MAAKSWKGFKSKYDYDEAVHCMNKGYSQLGKVVNKLDEGQVDSAIRHFNWANKDFNKALAYYADAVLPAKDKDAVNALKKGLDAFQKAEKDLQNNNVVAAQNNYDSAQNYFAQASILRD